MLNKRSFKLALKKEVFMKKALRFLGNFVLAAVIGFSMVSCPLPTDGNGGDTQFVNHGEVQVVVMNISEVEFDGVKSEWDWIAAVDNETKSLMLFNVDETGRIPTRLFYKPDKELDVGMTFVCRENGLPEMMEFNGYILYFDNFNGWTFDLAVVAPDETIEYHYGIEYDVDFDSWTHGSWQASRGAPFSAADVPLLTLLPAACQTILSALL